MRLLPTHINKDEYKWKTNTEAHQEAACRHVDKNFKYKTLLLYFILTSFLVFVFKRYIMQNYKLVGVPSII